MTPAALRRFGAACLLAALSACSGSPTEPARLQGTYRLRSIGESPVPVVVAEEVHGSITVLAASFTFQGDSVRLERTEHWVERGADGQVLRSEDRVISERHPYSLVGDRLVIGRPCPPDPAALCAYSEAGVVEGSRLAMRVWYSREPWSYERAHD